MFSPEALENGLLREISPLDLDRRLRRAHAAWLGFRERLAEEVEEDDDPLGAFRALTGKSLFDALGAQPEDDPLRAPLRRWVYRLGEQRINQGALVRLEQAWRTPREVANAPTGGRPSLREMLSRCLSDSPRRVPWASAFLAHAEEASLAAAALWQRRREVASRMGLSGPDDVEIVGANGVECAAACAAATRDRLRDRGASSLPEYVTQALGADVPGEFPGRLTPLHVLEPFRSGDLLRSLELRPRRLPESLGAASYCRALGVLGAAWLEALAPRDQPFVVACDPYGLSRHRASALFAALPLNLSFARRHLGVPKHAQVDYLRRVSEIAMGELAAAALRVRLRGPALSGERELRQAFSDLAEGDLGLSLPEAAAGTLFRLGVEDRQRFFGLVLSADWERRLIEEHDEDWFRNPRAIEQLRADAMRPPEVAVEAEALADGLDLALRRLNAGLG